MANISKLAFLRTIWLLKDYLTDIVIGGGWAPLIYCHYLLGDKTKNPVRTFDIDLMVKNTVPVRGEKKKQKRPKIYITFSKLFST